IRFSVPAVDHYVSAKNHLRLPRIGKYQKSYSTTEITALPRPRSVRHGHLRHSQHRRDSIGITDVEEHAFGDHARHFPWRKIHDEKSLLAFDLARIGSLPFHPGKNCAPVVAEADF